RQWCKTCDPGFLVRSWNVEDETIREFILNNVKKANHYDDPFLEYIPYGNLEIIERIGEGGYGVVYHAKWHDGLRYCDGNVKSKHKVIDVAMKEIKSGEFNLMHSKTCSISGRSSDSNLQQPNF
ncbi:11317_t:CDS:2, partial [Entrophospora sp. SA101]